MTALERRQVTIDELMKLVVDGVECVFSKDCIYEGLTILKKYHPHGAVDYSFQHDQMWISGKYAEDYLKIMSNSDAKLMVGLGWIVSEDYWSHF